MYGATAQHSQGNPLAQHPEGNPSAQHPEGNPSGSSSCIIISGSSCIITPFREAIYPAEDVIEWIQYNGILCVSAVILLIGKLVGSLKSFFQILNVQ